MDEYSSLRTDAVKVIDSTLDLQHAEKPLPNVSTLLHLAWDAALKSEKAQQRQEADKRAEAARIEHAAAVELAKEEARTAAAAKAANKASAAAQAAEEKAARAVAKAQQLEEQSRQQEKHRQEMVRQQEEHHAEAERRARERKQNAEIKAAEKKAEHDRKVEEEARRKELAKAKALESKQEKEAAKQAKSVAAAEAVADAAAAAARKAVDAAAEASAAAESDGVADLALQRGISLGAIQNEEAARAAAANAIDQAAALLSPGATVPPSPGKEDKRGGSTAERISNQRLERSHSRIPAIRSRSASAETSDVNSAREKTDDGHHHFERVELPSAIKKSKDRLKRGSKEEPTAKEATGATGSSSSGPEDLGSMLAATSASAPSSSWLESWRGCDVGKGAELEAACGFYADCLALASDGDTLVSIGGDGDDKNVSVYSANTGSLTRNMKGHTHQICSVAVQGELVASGARDCTIRLWSLVTGSCEAVLEGSDDQIYGLSLLGDLLLSGEGSKGSSTAKVRLWSLTSHQVLHAFARHTGPVWSVELGPGVAASASHDSTARVWSTLDGKEKGKMGHPDHVYSVSLQGTVAATACGDGNIRLWSARTFACLRTFAHGGSGAFSALASPAYSVRLSGEVLVSGGQDKHVRVWSLTGIASCTIEEAECVATMTHGANVKGLALSPLGGFVASAGGSPNKRLIVWRPLELGRKATAGGSPGQR